MAVYANKLGLFMDISLYSSNFLCIDVLVLEVTNFIPLPWKLLIYQVQFVDEVEGDGVSHPPEGLLSLQYDQIVIQGSGRRGE